MPPRGRHYASISLPMIHPLYTYDHTYMMQLIAEDCRGGGAGAGGQEQGVTSEKDEGKRYHTGEQKKFGAGDIGGVKLNCEKMFGGKYSENFGRFLKEHRNFGDLSHKI